MNENSIQTETVVENVRLSDKVAQAIFDTWTEERRSDFLEAADDRDHRPVFACKAPACNVERDAKKPRRSFETDNVGLKLNGRGAFALWIRTEESVRADGSLNIYCAYCSNKEKERAQLAVVEALVAKAAGKVEELMSTGWAKNEAEAWSHDEVIAIIGKATKSAVTAKQVAWAHKSVQAIQPFVPFLPVYGRLVQLLRGMEDEAVAEVIANEMEMVTCPLTGKQFPRRDVQSARVCYSSQGMDYVLAELCEDALQSLEDAEPEDAAVVVQLVKKLQGIMDRSPAGQTELPLMFSAEAVQGILDTLAPNGWVYIDENGRKLRPFEPARDALVRMARARIRKEAEAEEKALVANRRQSRGLGKVRGWLGGDKHGSLA